MLTPEHPRDPDFQERCAPSRSTAVPVVAYGALVPPSALEIPRLGWVNLHFSLLPAWRGAAPVQHAVLAGDEVTGATTFLLEQGLDTGPVLGLLTETIRPTDTSGDLLDRLAVAGAGLLVASLDALEDGTRHAVPQPADGVSLAPKLTVDDARVDWSAPALRVDRLIRACTPAPGRLDDLPRQAGQARAGRRSPTTRLRSRACVDGRPGRHRHPRGAARRVQPRARARWRRPTGCAACASSPASASRDRAPRRKRAAAARPARSCTSRRTTRSG